MESDEKGCLVIPAYNEEAHISEVISEAKKEIKNIVVVDDGSIDGTYRQAKETGVVVLRHLINLGKGAALRTGCDYALHKGAKKIIVMDADTQHDPHMIPRFLSQLKNAEIVFGYRGLSSSMPFVLRFGNRFISTMARFLYGMQLKDTQCGYRAFTAEAYGKIRWQASDYSMESEMIARAGRQKLRYAEIPIQTIYSDKYKGTTVLDGIKIVLKMVWWKVS